MKSGRGVAPTTKNGSRATTSQKQTRSEPGSLSRAIRTRSGPPHITSTSPARSARAASSGSEDGRSSTSTPARLKAPLAWAA